MKRFSCIFFFYFLLNISCKSSYFLTEVSESNNILDSTFLELDTSILNIIYPYQTSIEEKMNVVVGRTNQEFTKQKPESTLGNLLADATLEFSQSYFSTKTDIAIINYGGIRIANLPEGDITLGQIYELMPFDNYLVQISIDGATLQKVFDLMASRGGWPISGARYFISEGKAKDIFINNQSLKLDSIYSIALSDYLANGGDNLEMLKNFPQKNKSILLRDVFIHYFQSNLDKGNMLSPKLDNRVINE